jgi:putative N-acetylmannosamine-6-phosphate epimerase
MWIDITVPMDESYPCWPGDLVFKETVTSVIGEYGATCNMSTIAMSSHFGTHLDAPFHFVKNGKTIDEIDVDLLVGRCTVIAVENERLVEACHVKPLIEHGIRRLLIKTDNSKRDFRGEFRKDFVGISVTGTTGVRESISLELEELVMRVKAETSKPVAVGFGIAKPEHAACIARFADGVIVGSALVEQLEGVSTNEERLAVAHSFVVSLRAAMNSAL